MGVALLNDEFKKALKRNSLDQLLAGIASGIVSTSLLHPLDLVKTQFQVDQSSRSTLMKAPFLYTFRHLHAQLKAFGVRSGLYRGLSANLLGAASSWGIYFYLYDCAKKMFPTDHYGHRAPIQNFVASGSASAMTVLITNPVWLVKTRLCTQNPLDPLRYTGFFNALRRIFQEEGVSGWYRGLVPGLFGISHGAVQFMIYEELKKHYQKNSVMNYLFMSSASKVTAMAITYPYQVLRSRLQFSCTPNESLMRMVRQMSRNEGIWAFYRGIVPSTIRVLPGTCITFLVYEQVSALFKN